MDVMPVAMMNLGLLGQNFGEWRSGGPLPPARLGSSLRLSHVTAQTRLLALLMVSSFVLGACVIGLTLDTDWLFTAISAALIANALTQLGVSVWKQVLQPGTLSGLTLMLPTAIWTLVAAGFTGGWIAVIAGPILSFPLLLLCWQLAVLMSD